MFNSKSSFFTAKYRPILSLFFVIKYKIFGNTIFYHFLVSVFFYALSTVFLFNIFNWILGYYTAFLIALIYVFNPIVSYNFGLLGQEELHIISVLVLLILIHFKKYLDTGTKKSYYFSLFLYVFALFIREVVLFLPVIIFLGICIYKFDKCKSLCLFKSFIYSLKKTYILFLMSILYIIFRIILFPISFSKFTSFSQISLVRFCLLSSLNNFIKSCFLYTKLLVYNLSGLSLILGDSLIYKFIRISLFVLIVALLFWLFIKNTKKVYIIYFFLSFLGMLWIQLVRGDLFYMRNLFVSYYFLFIALVFFVKFYYGPQRYHFKKIGNVLVFIVAIFFMFFNIKIMSDREKMMDIRSKAIKKFIKNEKIKNKEIYFCGLPNKIFSICDKELFMLLTENLGINFNFDFSINCVDVVKNNIKKSIYVTWDYKKNKFITF